MGSTLEAKRELATYRGDIEQVGSGAVVIDTETSTIDIGTANAISISAAIAGAPASGSFVSVTSSLDTTGTFIAHTIGDNLKTTIQTASYVCVYRNVPRFVKIKANVTDGNVTVRFQPVQI